MSRSRQGTSRSLAFAVNDFESGWAGPVYVPPSVCVCRFGSCCWPDWFFCLVSWRYRSLRRCCSLKLFSWLLAEVPVVVDEVLAVAVAAVVENAGDDDEGDKPEVEADGSGPPR